MLRKECNLTVLRETLTQYITFTRGGRGESVLLYCVVLQPCFLFCIDPSMRIVTKSPKVGPLLYSNMYFPSLWVSPGWAFHSEHDSYNFRGFIWCIGRMKIKQKLPPFCTLSHHYKLMGLTNEVAFLYFMETSLKGQYYHILVQPDNA